LKNAAHRVADQEDIDAGLVQNPRKGIIVSGEAGNLFTLVLFFDDIRYGDLLSHLIHPPKTGKPSAPSRKANNGEW